MKVPFVDHKLYTNVLSADLAPTSSSEILKTATTVTLTKCRSSTIVRNFIGHIIAIHDGKVFKRLTITAGMIGHKLGEFVYTKRLGSSIHNSDRNAKKKEKLRRKITQKKVRKTATTKKKVSKTATTKK